MGRSFDRGGRSRKERDKGKRRAFQQAERDREARQAAIQARRVEMAAEIAGKRRVAAPLHIVATEAAQPTPTPQPGPAMQAAIVTPASKPGFMSQLFRRFFKKSA